MLEEKIKEIITKSMYFASEKRINDEDLIIFVSPYLFHEIIDDTIFTIKKLAFCNLFNENDFRMKKTIKFWGLNVTYSDILTGYNFIIGAKQC